MKRYVLYHTTHPNRCILLDTVYEKESEYMYIEDMIYELKTRQICLSDETYCSTPSERGLTEWFSFDCLETVIQDYPEEFI